MSFSNHREYTTLSTIESDLHFEKDKNYLFDLSYLSTLAVEGEKASEFLQGQLSCDLREVNSKAIRQGAICNLKGRVLALTDVIDWQGLQLVLPKDLRQATEESLSKIAMLSRVILEPTNTLIYGFYLANQNDLLPDTINLPNEDLGLTTNASSCCYRLSKEFYLILMKEASEFYEDFNSRQQLRGSLAWHYLQLKSKTIEIYPQSRGLFLPHRIDLHLSGYLSFDKGCYKGQEIIARTHYRAKLKHRLAVFTIETTEPFNLGAKLFSVGEKIEVGELIDSCAVGENRFLIAVSILFDAPEKVLIEGQIEPVDLLASEELGL